MSIAWAERADQLTAWTMTRLVNRTDVWGAYATSGPVTRPAVVQRGKVALTQSIVRQHFAATKRQHVIGLHAGSIGPNSTAKWCAIDIDKHDEESPSDPQANEAAALVWFARLQALGFKPLLSDSNGKGGFHLRVPFDAPIPLAVSHRFGHWLTADHAELMVPVVEVFPKQERLGAPGSGDREYGSWLRIPGRHHSREHWSKVWDGECWLDDHAAVDFILAMKGDSPALIPDEAKNWTKPAQLPVAPAVVGCNGSIHEFTSAEKMRRATLYLDKIPPAISGRKGHNATFVAALKVAPGFDLSNDQAMAVFAAWNARCEPPWTERELTHKIQDAQNRSDRSRGYLLHRPLTRNKKQSTDCPAVCQPVHSAGAIVTGAILTGAQIILAYFKEKYRPVFRRGNAIACADGEEIRMADGVSGAPSALIDRLATATDAPRYQDGNIKRQQLPSFFRQWSRTAWADILLELPAEDDATLTEDAPARETFRRLVREALLSEVTLGDTIGASGNVTHSERRSLAEWCQRFAKLGPWRDIRSKRSWTKFRQAADGELILMIAIRHELFAQLRADRRLSEMGAKVFARRAARYGVGRSTPAERPHGVNAIVLSDDFVCDLIAGLPDDPDESHRMERDTGAHA